MAIPAMMFATIFLQAKAPSSAGIGGIAPVLMPDVPVWEVLVFGALNPAVIAVAFLMGRALGRQQGQRAKLGIAAFAGAVAGIALLWIGTHLNLTILATPARASGGIFIVSFVAGIVYAWVGYAMGARERPGN